jgi:P2 family phage major capsid protein
MKALTAEKIDAYTANIAQLNGVRDVSRKFAVVPAVAQTMEQRIQQSTTFLQSINVYGVDNQSGEKIGMDAATSIASRTDTANGGTRNPVDISAMDGNQYFCRKTDFDVAFRYAQLDQWAHHPEFETILRDIILKRIALDRITIGWNGTSAAANTNRAAHPLLQDVNIGWLQKYREKAAAQVMTEVVAASGKVRVVSGLAAADGYDNLDALAYDAKNNLVDITYREDPELVVILGSSLLADKYFPIINKPQRPEDLLLMDMLVSQKRVGGMPAVSVPYFPANTMMITKLKNLSIYFQNGSHRRNIVDRSEKDRIENFQSVNEDYVVEDFRCGAVVENIALI